jgi:threonine synthase
MTIPQNNPGSGLNPNLVGYSCLRYSTHWKKITSSVGDDGIGCPSCREDGLPVSVRLSYGDIDRTLNASRIRSGKGMSRFGPLLAYSDFPDLGAGDTPLISVPTLASQYGVGGLWLKLESANPASHSHKDRCMAPSAYRAKRLGKTVVAAASSGNAGLSLAAYAAANGLECVIVTTDDISEVWASAIEAYGARLQFTRTSMERWSYLKKMRDNQGWYVVTNCEDPPVGSNPFGVEGYETIAWELSEQLYGAIPSHIIVPTARGDVLWGIWYGFRRAHKAGLIGSIPKMVAVEPIARLEKVLAGSSYTSHFQGDAHSMSSIGGGTVTFQSVQALLDSKGFAITVGEEQTAAARNKLAALGYDAEQSAAAALAGLDKMYELGRLNESDTPVLIITSAGYKDRKPSGAKRLYI